MNGCEIPEKIQIRQQQIAFFAKFLFFNVPFCNSESSIVFFAIQFMIEFMLENRVCPDPLVCILYMEIKC